jgi:hypothetical protein
MIKVNNASLGEWEVYSQEFDPVAVLSRLGRNADDLLVEADSLLSGRADSGTRLPLVRTAQAGAQAGLGGG